MQIGNNMIEQNIELNYLQKHILREPFMTYLGWSWWWHLFVKVKVLWVNYSYLYNDRRPSVHHSFTGCKSLRSQWRCNVEWLMIVFVMDDKERQFFQSIDFEASSTSPHNVKECFCFIVFSYFRSLTLFDPRIFYWKTFIRHGDSNLGGSSANCSTLDHSTIQPTLVNQWMFIMIFCKAKIGSSHLKIIKKDDPFYHTIIFFSTGKLIWNWWFNACGKSF